MVSPVNKRPRLATLQVAGPLASIAAIDTRSIELRALIGSGASGEVYAAWDNRTKRALAIKILARDDLDAVARFVREAEIQARLTHPNVCAIFGGGRLTDDRLFVALELLDEGTLDGAGDRLSLAERLRLVREAALGLHAAHAEGLIHRDVKPSNILLGRHQDRRLRACIGDFGAARALDRSAQTVSGVAIGTPEYMAPEQIFGAEVDRRTDVYGLGATLYRLACGRAPYRGTPAQILAAVRRRDPLPLRQQEPSLPSALSIVVMRAMERDPADRYETAQALADDLGRILDDRPITARPPTAWRRARRWLKRNGATLASLVVIALAALAGLGVAHLIDRRQSRQLREAQRYVHEVAYLGETLRRSAMRPLHDVASEREKVAHELSAIAAALPSLDGDAGNLARLALGRGHLALGEPAAALAPLEEAHRANGGDVDVGFALGQALGARYREMLDEADAVDDADERADARRDAQARFRDRALPLLVARRGGVDPAELIEAQIAFYEDRLDEAAALASTVEKAQPWLFEATRLRGDVEARRGVKLREAGQIAQAEQAFARAVAIYEETLKRAPSDALAQSGACAVWGQRLHALYDQSKLGPDSFVEPRQRCHDARVVLPSPAAMLASADVMAVQARYADEHGEPEQGAKILDEEIALLRASPDVKLPRLQQALAMALLERANAHERRGEDGRVVFDEAIAISRAQLGGRMMRELVRDLSIAAMRRAERGDDGLAVADLAVDIGQRAVAQSPGNWVAHNSLGNALRARGYAEVLGGRNPVEDFTRAVAEYRTVERMSSGANYGFFNECNTQLDAVRYFLDLGSPGNAPLDEAERVCAASLRADPNFGGSHFGLADAMLLRASSDLGRPRPFAGDIERATAEMEAGRRIDPRSDDLADLSFRRARLRVQQALAEHRDTAREIDDAQQALDFARGVGFHDVDALELELARWEAEAALAAHRPVTPFVDVGRRALARRRGGFAGDAHSLIEAAALEVVAARAGATSSLEVARQLLDEALRRNPNLAGLAAPLRAQLR